MTADYCRGCGSVLQSADPNRPGYIPATVHGRSQVCQRCYRMIHYGEAGRIQPDPEQIKINIRKAIELSQLLLVVVDFTDLTGTLPVWSGLLTDKPYLLIVNKIDLLPVRTKQTEVIVYLKHYSKDKFFKDPEAIVLTSGLKGIGVASLQEAITKAVPAGARIGLLGTTNAGKSSLIKQMLLAEKSTQFPTVSKFPGTTLGLSNWSILKGRNTLIDTPGLTTGDRIGDLLCPDCASQLAQSAKLGQKLWGIKPGKGLIIEALFGLANLGTAEAVLISFTPLQLRVHRAGNSKIPELLDIKAPWLSEVCKNCLARLRWRQQETYLAPGSDLAIAGLGWISVRGTAVPCKFWLPEKVRWEIRPALVGKKHEEIDNSEF